MGNKTLRKINAGSRTRTIVLRFRMINRDIFSAIRNGKKKVETRAATEKYQNIKTGDTVTLACGKSKFKKIVKRAKFFKTITAILKEYKAKEINPSCKGAKELQEMYFSFPGYSEKIKKYGIVAWELK